MGSPVTTAKPLAFDRDLAVTLGQVPGSTSSAQVRSPWPAGLALQEGPPRFPSS